MVPPIFMFRNGAATSGVDSQNQSRGKDIPLPSKRRRYDLRSTKMKTKNSGTKASASKSVHGSLPTIRANTKDSLESSSRFAPEPTKKLKTTRRIFTAGLTCLFSPLTAKLWNGLFLNSTMSQRVWRIWDLILLSCHRKC